MADYLQDLVQNIYTNCDMSGFNDYNKAVNNLDKSVKQSARERIRLNELEQKSLTRIEYYKRQYAVRQQRLGLQSAQLSLKENGLLSKKLWLWHRIVRLVGIYFGINTIRNIIRTGSELQLIQKSITGLTGSGQDWQFLDQQAYRFGLSLKTVSQGYKNFYSSASMAGFDRGQIQGMFSDMLLGARSIGASDQQIGGALLALEQMMSKGRVSMEELRRQLGNALPGAFEIGAKAMGVTTQKFNEMVKAGISAQEFVPKFIKTFKEQYANGWKDVEQTVAVAQGRLTVAWESFTMNFMHGEAGRALAQGINQLAEFMRSPAFAQFVDLLGKIFTLTVKLFSFAIKHIATITILLGTGGLLAVLPQIVKWLALIKFNLETIFAYGVINGIKYLTRTLWALNAPILVLYAKILAVIAALLILEDIYTGIFHPEKESYTKDLLGGSPQEIQQNGNQYLRDKYRKENQEFVDRQNVLKNMPMTISAPKNNLLGYNAPSIPQIIPNSGYVEQGGVYQKDETVANNVTIGDINIYSNSSNPQEVAQEVQNQLVALFMGQGLMTNVGETVVG